MLGTLEQLGLPYWVTGSDALALTGYARSTVEVDIVVDITPVDYDARLRLAWGAGASARRAEDAARILAASPLDLAYCRWAAAELGVARELEGVLEAAHAG